MGKILLITGGARSGKSRIAEAETLALGQPAIYIATAEVRDGEMAERVAKHQARRGPEWRTLAEPLALTDQLRQTDGQGPRLVDCLTLWLTNVMLGEHDIEASVSDLIDTIPYLSSPVVFVTNEVGSGIVPATKLGRDFRDHAGALNQRVAALADTVTLAISGLPLKVK